MQTITIIDRRRGERAAPAVETSFIRITERAAVGAVEAFFSKDDPLAKPEKRLEQEERPGYAPRASSQRSHVVR